MARSIFIDTGAFLALEDASDQHHQEAVQFRDEVLAGGSYDLITTSYILDEVLTLIRSRLGIPASIRFCRAIRRSRALQIVSVSQEIEERALDLFEHYHDKNFSFTDCVSFVVMKDREIQEAFAFDHHFEQIGFVRRP